MTFRSLISKIISGVGSTKPKTSKPHEAEALFHWKVLLNTFFVVAILILAVSFFVHADISRGDFSTVKKAVSPDSNQVTVERLEKLASYFDTKRVTFEQVRRGRVLVVDPSR